jgi:hypothetical protein
MAKNPENAEVSSMLQRPFLLVLSGLHLCNFHSQSHFYASFGEHGSLEKVSITWTECVAKGRAMLREASQRVTNALTDRLFGRRAAVKDQFTPLQS